MHAHRLARTICARAHLRAQKFLATLLHSEKLRKIPKFVVIWWNQCARANARAPKKLLDSNWWWFIDCFYFLYHVRNFKTREDIECRTLVKNEKFIIFNSQCVDFLKIVFCSMISLKSTKIAFSCHKMTFACRVML